MLKWAKGKARSFATTALNPSETRVSFHWPPINIEATWIPTDRERQASWELYVELITRISVVELPWDQGLLRESLSSLHAVFEKTRAILRTYGPEVAHTSDADNMSFGYLAIIVLNYILRPFLTKWHPRLLDWESKRESAITCVEHERAWEYNVELRRELGEIRLYLIEYADLLARVARVPSLVLTPNVPTTSPIPETTLRNEKLEFYSPRK